MLYGCTHVATVGVKGLFPRNAQNDHVCAPADTRRKDALLACRLLRIRSIFREPVTVSVWVCRPSIHFVDHYYREVLLKRDLFPNMREICENSHIIPTGQCVGVRKLTRRLSCTARESPDFIPATLCRL